MTRKKSLENYKKEFYDPLAKTGFLAWRMQSKKAEAK